MVVWYIANYCTQITIFISINHTTTLTLVIFRKYWAALLKVYLTNARNFMIKHFECQHVKTNDTRSVDILSVQSTSQKRTAIRDSYV